MKYSFDLVSFFSLTRQ